jgi:AcrR family transcriptional regulator
MPPDPEQTLSRRERKKRETRKRILEAAVTLMSQRAFDEVRIEDICAAADVANATFFLHFSNKPALVNAFGGDITERLREVVLEPDLTSAQKLHRLLARYLREWQEHRNLMHQIVVQFVSTAATSTSFNEVAPGFVDIVSQTIRQGQERGEFLGSIKPDIASLALVASWNAIALSAPQAQDATDTEKALWQTLELFIAALTLSNPLNDTRLQSENSSGKRDLSAEKKEI